LLLIDRDSVEVFLPDREDCYERLRRADGRVRFLVREDLQDVDEEIAEYGDGSVILCTDDYTIYDDIDDFDGIDAHLAITHDDTYVIGDVHVNSCENRHSFLRQWLATFRSVSKQHIQGYLDFLALLLNDDTDWFSKILSYESSGRAYLFCLN
jgi:hypothetical protein